ncbi:MAG: D-aminoacyl-tRNA deacylase [Clostridiales bacterium]
MKAVIQRVLKSEVIVKNETVGKINNGILVLLGIGKDDKSSDIEYLANKIINMRIFEDSNDKMNLSLMDIKGELLIVSQFTVYGDCRKGRRPSFDKAAKPKEANKLYDEFVDFCISLGIKVNTGIFQQHMNVIINNDGPVTFIVESN